MTETISEPRRERILEAIAGQAGLHFPPERWPEVERNLEAAAEELRVPSVEHLARGLLDPLPEPHLMEVVAKHLTVGETYFFRDAATFAVLRNDILAPLIQERRAAGDLRLRLWSAGCCTGEEAYSLAILVSELLPDLPDWKVTILGTDINREFLRVAEAGIYKKWSFRGTSKEFRTLHFTPLPAGKLSILPRFREMVTFRFLNLAEDCYPSFATETESIDVILCRNVLIYFSAEQCRRASVRLQASLAPGGWLVPSAAEPGATFAPLTAVSFPAAIAYRKEGSLPLLPAPAPADDSREEGSPARPAPNGKRAAPAAPDLEELVRQSRARANAGELEEALRLCDLALQKNRLDSRLHYLRGSILQEREHLEEAMRSFRRAVHLDHGFALAHFALGTLAGKKGRRPEQIRHFEAALEILRASPPDQIVPESSGITAARLAEVIVAGTRPSS